MDYSCSGLFSPEYQKAELFLFESICPSGTDSSRDAVLAPELEWSGFRGHQPSFGQGSSPARVPPHLGSWVLGAPRLLALVLAHGLTGRWCGPWVERSPAALPSSDPGAPRRSQIAWAPSGLGLGSESTAGRASEVEAAGLLEAFVFTVFYPTRGRRASLQLRLQPWTQQIKTHSGAPAPLRVSSLSFPHFLKVGWFRCK